MYATFKIHIIYGQHVMHAVDAYEAFFVPRDALVMFYK